MVCSVRVMSFNVRGASHMRDGVNVWEQRAAMNVETIRRYGPDLIGLQEVQEPNLDVYERELPGYASRHGQADRTHRLDPDPGRRGANEGALVRDPARRRRGRGDLPERPLPGPRRTRAEPLVSNLFRRPRITGVGNPDGRSDREEWGWMSEER